MRYLGVDLAWGEGSEAKPANRSGVVALEPSGTISDAGWTIGLEATIDWIQQHANDDTLLFVDAPLVITNASGPRLADRQTGQRYGRWWVSANSVNLNSPCCASPVPAFASCASVSTSILAPQGQGESRSATCCAAAVSLDAGGSFSLGRASGKPEVGFA